MKKLAVAVAFLLTLAACGGGAPAEIVIEDAWARTTDGATDKSMTAAFMSLTNPGDKDIQLTDANCPDAGMTQIHEMAMVDGKKVMQEAKGGVKIPAGTHVHLEPGGYHVMLMKLPKELPIGSEVACTLKFDNGQESEVKMLVKKFTEEEDHYHTPEPTPAS